MNLVEKKGVYHFGFKNHHVTDDKDFVVGVLTTIVSNNEIANLEEVLDIVNIELFKDIPLNVDKGYQSKNNVEILKKLKLRTHILKKARKKQTFNKMEI